MTSGRDIIYEFDPIHYAQHQKATKTVNVRADIYDKYYLLMCINRNFYTLAKHGLGLVEPSRLKAVVVGYASDKNSAFVFFPGYPSLGIVQIDFTDLHSYSYLSYRVELGGFPPLLVKRLISRDAYYGFFGHTPPPLQLTDTAVYYSGSHFPHEYDSIPHMHEV